MSRDHELFKHFPLEDSVRISAGSVRTPYHVYDGQGVLIGCTVDLAAVEQLLRNETFTPVGTSDRRTFMGIWVCNFTDASLDPHHELQFSFFSNRKSIEPVSSTQCVPRKLAIAWVEKPG